MVIEALRLSMNLVKAFSMRTAGGEVEISGQHGALERSQQTSDNTEYPSRTTAVEMILCTRGIA
jgi:hypothetical protein